MRLLFLSWVGEKVIYFFCARSCVCSRGEGFALFFNVKMSLNADLHFNLDLEFYVNIYVHVRKIFKCIYFVVNAKLY